jgi:Septum formation
MAIAEKVLKAGAALLFGLVKRFPIWTAIGVFAVGGYFLRDVLTGNVVDLKVGDCFDVPTATKLLKDVQHHPCTVAHDAEMLFVGFMPGTSDTYPASPDFDHFVKVLCVPAYESYTGRTYETDITYELHSLVPTTDGWKAGDHGVTCFVMRADGTQLMATVKAAR